MASNNLNRNSSNNGILAILDAAAMTSASNSPASNVQEGVPAQTSNHQSEGPAEPRTNSASNPVVKRQGGQNNESNETSKVFPQDLFPQI